MHAVYNLYEYLHACTIRNFPKQLKMKRYKLFLIRSSLAQVHSHDNFIQQDINFNKHILMRPFEFNLVLMLFGET